MEGELTTTPPQKTATVSYQRSAPSPSRQDAARRVVRNRADGARTPRSPGPIVLNLWVSSTGEDTDIFATLRNIGPDGKDVCEVGQQGEPLPCVTKGWLRASHRKLDPEKSLPVPAVPRARRAVVAETRRDRRMPGRNLADLHGVQEGPQAAPRHVAGGRRRARSTSRTSTRTTTRARRPRSIPAATSRRICCCRSFRRGSERRRMTADAALTANALKAWRFLYRRGFIEGFGHLSARLPGTDRFLLTRHSLGLKADADDFLLVDMEGRKLAGRGDLPGEYPIHLEILRSRPDVGSVIHYHGMYSTAFTTSEQTLKPIHSHGHAVSRRRAGVPGPAAGQQPAAAARRWRRRSARTGRCCCARTARRLPAPSVRGSGGRRVPVRGKRAPRLHQRRPWQAGVDRRADRGGCRGRAARDRAGRSAACGRWSRRKMKSVTSDR